MFCACRSKDHNFCLNFWYWIKIIFCGHVIDGVKVSSNCQVKKSRFCFGGIFFADIQQSWDAFVIRKICKTSHQRTSEMIIPCKSELKILIHCNLIKMKVGPQVVLNDQPSDPNDILPPLSHQAMVDWLGCKKNACQVIYSKITFSRCNIYFAYKVVKCDYKRKSHASLGIISAYFSFACTCYNKIEESSPLC